MDNTAKNNVIIEDLEKIKSYTESLQKTLTESGFKGPWPVVISAQADAIKLRAEMALSTIKSTQDAGNWYGNELLQDDEQINPEICTCEMPAKVKGENGCWRCKKELSNQNTEK